MEVTTILILIKGRSFLNSDHHCKTGGRHARKPAQGRFGSGSSPMDDIALGLRPELLIRSDDVRTRLNDTRTRVVDDSNPRL